MTIHHHTFKKEERLTHKKHFSLLFSAGKNIKKFPVMLLYQYINEDLPYPAQAAFAVSKKRLGKATDRNKVKRQMREVYRENKSALYEILKFHNKKMIMIFVYLSNKKLAYKLIEDNLCEILIKLRQDIEKLPNFD